MPAQDHLARRHHRQAYPVLLLHFDQNSSGHRSGAIWQTNGSRSASPFSSTICRHVGKSPHNAGSSWGSAKLWGWRHHTVAPSILLSHHSHHYIPRCILYHLHLISPHQSCLAATPDLPIVHLAPASALGLSIIFPRARPSSCDFHSALSKSIEKASTLVVLPLQYIVLEFYNTLGRQDASLSEGTWLPSQILSQSTRLSSVNILVWSMYVNAAIHTIVLPVRMGPECSLYAKFVTAVQTPTPRCTVIRIATLSHLLLLFTPVRACHLVDGCQFM